MAEEQCDSASSDGMLPLSDNEAEDRGEITAAVVPFSAVPQAPAAGPLEDSPDMLPLTDDEMLSDGELEALSSKRDEAQNTTANANDQDPCGLSEFSLAAGKGGAKGAGRGRRRGRPKSDFSLVPSNLRLAAAEAEVGGRFASVQRASPNAFATAPQRTMWQASADLAQLEAVATAPELLHQHGRPQVIGGFAAAWPLSRQLLAARDCGKCADGQKRRSELQRVAAHFFNEERLRIANDAMVAEALRVDRKQLPEMMTQLACTFLGLDSGLRAWLDAGIVAAVPRMQLIHFRMRRIR